VLVPGHQHLRDIALLEQAEMPYLRIRSRDGLVPDARAGHRHVEHRQLRDFVRPLRSVRIGHHHADVASDQVDLGAAEMVDQRADIGGRGRLVVAALRLLRVAGTTVVHRNHAIARRRELRHDVAPSVPSLRPAMQQHDKLASLRPADHVVQPHAVGLGQRVGEIVLETRRQAGWLRPRIGGMRGVRDETDRGEEREETKGVSMLHGVALCYRTA
jgi:hypothetical protein